MRPQQIEHFRVAPLTRVRTVVYRPFASHAPMAIVRMKLDEVAHINRRAASM